jgi:hypothetical protein
MVLDLEALQQRLNNLLQSEVRLFIPQYYQEHLLMKGMIILREPVKEETGHELLQNLAKLWEHFFSNILPLLQAIFYPIETLNCSVRSLTLISFRDIVVLKTKLEDALMEKDVFVPPRIQQMLLVLQSIRSNPPSENFIKLESIVALVVSPYLKPSQLSHTIPSPNKHFKRSTGYMNRSRHRTQTEGADGTRSPGSASLQSHPINPIQESETGPSSENFLDVSIHGDSKSPIGLRVRCISDLTHSTSSLDRIDMERSKEKHSRSTLSLDELETGRKEKGQVTKLDNLKASVV